MDIIGAKVVEVESHVSSEIDWAAVQELRKSGRNIPHSQYPRKDVTHYGTITLELDDEAKTRVDIEPNSYYDSYWMEVR
jgi:hypothetical protein